MKRRNFLESLAIAGGTIATTAIPRLPAIAATPTHINAAAHKTDVLIAGGGLGGCSSALALLRNGHSVIMTEETDWIGGQMTQQAVPPDEHASIETHGAPTSYLVYRQKVREYYFKNYPLTKAAKDNPILNPGNGWVSRLCHEPKVGLAVLYEMLSPYISNGQLNLLLEHKLVSSDTKGKFVNTVTVRDLRSSQLHKIEAAYFIDATELGDLLPLTGTEYVTGTESKAETGELHAPEIGNPHDNQAFTACFALEYHNREDYAQKPADYNFWSKYIPQIQPAWPGKLLSLVYSDPRTLQPKTYAFDPTGASTAPVYNLWSYRRIIDKRNFEHDFYKSDITIINWPQNDYMLGNIIGASENEFKEHVHSAKQLGLSLLYWLQTEAPRPDGGKGWPGLCLNKDALGTVDGFAKYPYVREARRIRALFTVVEQHVGQDNRAKAIKVGENPNKAASFYDSVGIGYYPIDLHPTQRVNFIDFPSLKFEIPLGALIPVRMENIFPANKNIGTTHITNGCYRLHPVEWSIGEAVGLLLVYAKEKSVSPREVRQNRELLTDFQAFIKTQGIDIRWKD